MLTIVLALLALIAGGAAIFLRDVRVAGVGVVLLALIPLLSTL